MNSNLKKNAFWNTLGVTINSFNSLFFLVIINRINGVDTAGIFSFSFSIACLLYIIGIYQGRIYQVSDTTNKISNREYFVHKVIQIIIMMIVSFVFILFHAYSLEKNLVVVILCLYKAIEAFDETLFAYLQKNDELYIVGKSYFFRSIVGLVCFSIVDYFPQNFVSSCIFLALNSILFFLFSDIRKSYKYITGKKLCWEHIAYLYKDGFSVFAFSFLAVYIVNIPKYILDYFMSSSFQTIFGIIVMPGTVVSLCGQYIIAPALNKIVKAYEQKEYNLFRQLVLKISALLLIAGALIEVIAYLFGIPVLSVIYAIDLSNYKFDLLVIIVGAICYALAGIISTALITMRKNNIQLVIYLLDSLIGMVSCYFLIKNYGIHGATIGYFITMLCHIIMYISYYSVQLKYLK